ncbi:MAG: hypothetical protein U5K54_01485 [Cytophagales bacterium]|nr:hypothetical protein [Cytophagales bacterium]
MILLMVYSGSKSKWLGTVWAPYAAINVGSGTGNTDVTGALWSGTQVNIQSGVSIAYAPFQTCRSPTVNAGADKVVTCSTTSLQLDGSSTTAGVTYRLRIMRAMVVSSTASANTATPTVNNAAPIVNSFIRKLYSHRYRISYTQ